MGVFRFYSVFILQIHFPLFILISGYFRFINSLFTCHFGFTAILI